MGECGLRGCYFEVHIMTQRAEDIFYKLKSIVLCTNTVGLMSVELMVNPLKRGRESDACVDQYLAERTSVMDRLKERAKLLTHSFNSMTNVSCTKIEGAIYGLPKLNFSKNFIDQSLSEGN